MFSKLLSISTLFLLTLFFLPNTACKREPVYFGELPDPTDSTANPTNTHPCSPDSIYFDQQILPLLRSNCAMTGCHDAASAEDGVILDSYNNVRNTGGIKINDPSDSKLYEAITETDLDDRMPPAPQPPLSVEQKALILKWIQQGAQNLQCDVACDTTNIRYSTVIQPLLNTKCVGCHTGSSASAGIVLSNYNDVKNLVDNQKLWGSINHQAGYKPMPYPAGGAKLPQCELDQIRIWIQSGAPNN